MNRKAGYRHREIFNSLEGLQPLITLCCLRVTSLSLSHLHLYICTYYLHIYIESLYVVRKIELQREAGAENNMVEDVGELD